MRIRGEFRTVVEGCHTHRREPYGRRHDTIKCSGFTVPSVTPLDLDTRRERTRPGGVWNVGTLQWTITQSRRLGYTIYDGSFNFHLVVLNIKKEQKLLTMLKKSETSH